MKENNTTSIKPCKFSIECDYTNTGELQIQFKGNVDSSVVMLLCLNMVIQNVELNLKSIEHDCDLLGKEEDKMRYNQINSLYSKLIDYYNSTLSAIEDNRILPVNPPTNFK